MSFPGTLSPPSPPTFNSPSTTSPTPDSLPVPPPIPGGSLLPIPPPVPGGSVPSGNNGGGAGIGTTTIVGIAVGGVVALVLVAIIWVCIARKKSKEKPGVSSCWQFSLSPYRTMAEYLKSPSHPLALDAAGRGGEGSRKSAAPKPPEVSKAFTYKEFKEATDGFSPSNLLGEGGFGKVYKGIIAGNIVAVKQLKIGGGQGEREFRAEVEIISRVHHRHLVSLVGYCISASHRLLVYKYVPNGTLDQALHGPGKPCMDWATRMNIALGIARGLAYLHEDCHPRIIHRDIKGSNILLWVPSQIRT